MTTIEPGSIYSLFNIPSEDWANLNKRVFLVLASWRDWPYYQSLRQLSNYEQLKQVCQNWKSNTFHDLVFFSKELAIFAEHMVINYQSKLKEKLDELKYRKRPRREIYGDLLQVIIRMEKEMLGLKARSEKLSQQVERLDWEHDRADIHLKHPMAEWRALGSKPSNSLNAIRGRWETITADLANIKASLADTADDERATVKVKVELVDALDDWANLAKKARTFVANALAQRKYLDSDEWLYEDPIIMQGNWYRLTNSFLGEDRALDTYSNGNNDPFMGTVGNYSGQYWKFTRIADGWYRLTNMFLGEDRALDTYSNGNNDPFMGTAGNYSGQYWKFIPLGGGWYRLINMFLGEGRALDTYSNDKNKPFMGKTDKNYSGQYWKPYLRD